MNGDAARWEEAVAAAVKETRRMGQFGLTQSELERFGAALVTDSEQLAAMGDQLAHGEQLTRISWRPWPASTRSWTRPLLTRPPCHSASVSELRGRGDGVFMRLRRLDAVGRPSESLHVS